MGAAADKPLGDADQSHEALSRARVGTGILIEHASARSASPLRYRRPWSDRVVRLSGPSGTPRPAPLGCRCRIWSQRRSVGRVRTWTVAHAELKRERTRELARIGSNLNQIARWANTHKENAEALEVVTHLVAIERALDTLTVEGEPR